MGQAVNAAAPQVNAAMPPQQQTAPPAVQLPPQTAEPARQTPQVNNASETAELREQMMLLGTRASAAQQTIRSMQAQQARSGLGMRQDIVAAMERMNAYLGEAEAAVRAGDGAKGKRYLSSAERELDRLEKFLGR
jgi:hypothetical protein